MALANHSAFDELLLASLSSENAVRENSETQLTELLDNQPDTLAVYFLYAMRHSPHLEAKQTAAVLFRRYSFHATDDQASFWPRCQPATQAALKVELLESLGDDAPSDVRHKISDAVAHVAKNISFAQMKLAAEQQQQPQEHFWPELLQRLWTFMQSPSPALRESALRIFSVVPSVFGDQLTRYINEVATVLNVGLQDAANIDVQLAAAKAFVTFIQNIKNEHRGPFVSLIPVVLQVVNLCLERGKIDGAQICLEALIDLAETEPKFFRTMLRDVVQSMALMASNTQLDDGCRTLALEVVVSLTDQAPGMMRKMPDFVQTVIPVCLKMMMELEMDDDWSRTDSTEDMLDLDTPSSVGEQDLDRICCNLGGEVVFEFALQSIGTMVGRPEWEARHAALMAISAIGEGCYKKMREHLRAIVDAVIPLLRDPNPRVRFAACNALGQMSTDFMPREHRQTAVGFQSLFHAQVIPGLCEATRDAAHPRVQAHAAAAIVNFCDGAARTTLEPYLDMILTHLGQLLSSQYIIVQEQVVTTIATVADAAQEHFAKYYASFIPHLKHILYNAREKSHRLLRAKTMECVTLMGLAVGKDIFSADSPEVTAILQEMQANSDEDDPSVSYTLSSWARVCQILGKDFAPYMGAAIMPLLRSVKIKPDIITLEEDEDIDDENRDDWQLMSIDDQKLGIKTSALEEKRTACEMLCIYARQLQGSFAPFVQQVLPISLGLLKFYFEDGVRMYSAALMPYMLRAVQDCEAPGYGPAAAQAVWLQQIANPLMECIKSEYDPDAVVMELDALRDCLEVVGNEGLPGDLLSVLTQVLADLLNDYKTRCSDRQEARTKDEDYDAQGELALKEEESHDNSILNEVCDVVHVLFDIKRVDFLPYWDNLLNYFILMIEPSRAAADRQWAICVFDDLVEACGPSSAAYAHLFAGRILESITDSEPEVRQAACYGIGAMALHGGPEYTQILQQALPRLVSVINDQSAKAIGNIDATENAISAVAKIMRNPANGVPLDQGLTMLVGWLPFTEDQEEADFVYTYLCDLIEGQAQQIMNPAILVRVLDHFATTHGNGVLYDTVEERIVGAVKHVRNVLPAADVPQLMANLSAESQAKLASMLA
eukprot:m.227329 g.227329  ORF g.227329 m.227329 type:complete len:1114 (+) comp11571_c0_seq1:98-3439(+)